MSVFPRYGLYSSPFDPVLFDLAVSGSSCKNAFNSSIGVQSDDIDLSDILSGLRTHSPIPLCSDANTLCTHMISFILILLCSRMFVFPVL